MEKGSLIISEEAIEEFKSIYEKNFGEKLEKKVALEKAVKLLNLYKAICGSKNFSEKEKKNQNYEK